MSNEKDDSLGVPASEQAVGLSATSPRHKNGSGLCASIPHADEIRVEVAGAGFLRFDHYPSTTGQSTGFSVGASWSKYGEFCGGVMDRSEAVRLAWEILRIVRINDHEYPKWVEERERRYAQLDKYMARDRAEGSENNIKP